MPRVHLPLSPPPYTSCLMGFFQTESATSTFNFLLTWKFLQKLMPLASDLLCEYWNTPVNNIWITKYILMCLVNNALKFFPNSLYPFVQTVNGSNNAGTGQHVVAAVGSNTGHLPAHPLWKPPCKDIFVLRWWPGWLTFPKNLLCMTCGCLSWKWVLKHFLGL